jgi:hypothetical protein
VFGPKQVHDSGAVTIRGVGSTGTSNEHAIRVAVAWHTEYEDIANTIVQFRVNVSGVMRLSPTDAIGFTVAPPCLHFYE